MTFTQQAAPSLTDEGEALEVPLRDGERWWGGGVEDGVRAPYGTGRFARDLAVPVGVEGGMASPSGQSSPLLLSTHGRIIWSEQPFSFEFADSVLRVEGRRLSITEAGNSLREAYLEASRRFFPPSGGTPARQLFAAPQYNTWIEQPYSPTQESVQRFASGLIEAGLPPGTVIIDDNWAYDYGTWRFDAARFPDPAAMVRRLHDAGCPVMLWVVPFVSPDSAAFRHLEMNGLLVRDSTGETAVRRWWNGFSALLDLTNPDAVKWFTDQLDALRAETGVDGFKFDAGDVRDYRSEDRLAHAADPVEMCEAWARVGVRYSFNEFRACWRMGGQALGQRLQDKPPSWGPDGIGSLVPEMLAQAMIGHAYTCPDMIGGGEIAAMAAGGGSDQEFFVRYAQIAALSPMMQFSVMPHRVLDAAHLAAVRRALDIRRAELPRILSLVEAAAVSGEPVLRPMAYHAEGMDDVVDQFFLGPDLIVAPMTVPGANRREVLLPAGRWRADDGSLLEGPTSALIETPLDRLPRFERA